ncbi:hypothetical protein ILUMI_27274 [Ignelater luminosus]|uniref:Uncharacterized protein n=1 Tax=Ignelater luminosus TaxID=2038154 RepID=A0A8K0C572_IGNLU|nr:hypothetical protein ILUMI_27274 [Ignelater luminosus]
MTFMVPVCRKTKGRKKSKTNSKIDESREGFQKLIQEKVLKSMRKDKECPIKRIKNKEGQVLTENKDIMRWKKHFWDILEEQDADGGGGEMEAHSAVDPVSGMVSASRENCHGVTMEEYLEALERVKLGKSPATTE